MGHNPMGFKTTGRHLEMRDMALPGYGPPCTHLCLQQQGTLLPLAGRLRHLGRLGAPHLELGAV